MNRSPQERAPTQPQDRASNADNRAVIIERFTELLDNLLFDSENGTITVHIRAGAWGWAEKNTTHK